MAADKDIVSFEVKDHGYKHLLKELQMLDGSSTEVGFPEGSAYKGTEPLNKNMGVAKLAIIQELGTSDGHIPSRPANRMTYDNNLDKIARKSKNLYNQVVTGMTAEMALKQLGVWYEGKLKIGYRKGPFKPLAAMTLAIRAAKGRKSSVPLHDTKGMVNSITSKLRMRRRRFARLIATGESLGI